MTTEGQVGVPAHYRQLRAVALVVITALMVIAAAYAGIQLAGPEYESASRSQSRGAFLVAGAPALVLLVLAILLLFNMVWKPRLQGTALMGVGIAGPCGVDLDGLTAVKGSSARQGNYLTLRDGAQWVTVGLNGLSKQGLLNDVGAALRRGQDEGRYVLPAQVAGWFRIPAVRGAKSGSRPPGLLLPSLVVVALFFAGFILGLSIAG
jgi:hypothetical protein